MAASNAASSALPLPLAPVDLKGVVAGYGQLQVLHGVDLSLPAGSLSALVGPNGGGKTTLFRCLLGLVKPRAGTVRVQGSSAERARRSIGYVPQREHIDWRFPVSVEDVVLMGRYGLLGLFRRPGARDRELARKALDDVGMLRLARRQIGELSVGQQQRVFLARALAQQPDILLLDEPLAAVDSVTEQDILALLERLRDEGKAVLMATHDLSCVAGRFDRVVFLNGRVVAEGAPRDVFTEATLKATYGAHVVLVRVGERYFAVDAGAHH
jgi:ABC-type Mn2+/Zn2+ transport system ATPase subunit